MSRRLFVAVLVVIGAVGVSLEVAAWVTISRVGVEHAPLWALLFAFGGGR